MPILLILFLLIPLIEIYFLIKVGSVFGAGLTIFIVVSTAVIGAALVRQQGLSTWSRVQTQLGKANMPAVEMFEGVFILISGALLLTPGFFTDAIGFAFLLPPFRRFLIKRWFAKGTIQGFGQAGPMGAGPSNNSNNSNNKVIDVEFEDLDK